ncbi:MAG: 2-oxoacid:ferredoxin oxidoreductase subunit beta [Proteobacteria bacterium]|jgi:2-oxoglutarate/2-oxoacid ferredoxin oxidoreductase subunit beta|nr:2-oxoacid:ferredoxin oxidoreductase subunit beta [Pseudomonadota bacterium]
MFNQAEKIANKYLRQSMRPSIFCTGCGIGNVLNYTLRAIDSVGLDIDKVVFCSGIGCSSRLPGYVEADGLHTTHGRALAFATGVKLASPDLHVIVFTGDGDMAAIGGNHFIHAARRNVDLTVICVNNYNYGMTGGQASPTTPVQKLTTTTPYGSIEEPFDLCRLAIGAGAPFVARWTVGYPYETVQCIEAALRKKGFSFVELLNPCPTGYGKKNELRDPTKAWHWYKDNSITRSDFAKLSPAERAANKKIVVGTIWEAEKPEFTAQWKRFVETL